MFLSKIIALQILYKKWQTVKRGQYFGIIGSEADDFRGGGCNFNYCRKYFVKSYYSWKVLVLVRKIELQLANFWFPGGGGERGNLDPGDHRQNLCSWLLSNGSWFNSHPNFSNLNTWTLVFALFWQHLLWAFQICLCTVIPVKWPLYISSS